MDINIVKKLKHISLNMFKKILFSLTAVAIVISIYLIFFVAPVPVDPMDAGGDPINFKIFYFHVPIAVTAYLAFAVVFVSGIMNLRTKRETWDTRAVAASEIGVILVPLSFLSIRLWNRATVHPVVIGPGGGGISGDTVIGTVLVNIITFILLLVSLVILRMENEKLADEIVSIKRTKNL